MGKILKNLKAYWKTIIIIVLLLVVQAFCDLSLPTYTSELIDTGIQNSGVEHVVPEKITKTDHAQAAIFMTEDERQLWQDSYAETAGEPDVYSLQITEEEDLNELDEELQLPLVMIYQLNHMEASDLQDAVEAAPQTSKAPSDLQDAVEAAPQTSKAPSDVPDAVDDATETNLQDATDDASLSDLQDATDDASLSDLQDAAAPAAAMAPLPLDELRAEMEKVAETIGEDTLKSMGIAYAIECNEAAGVDMEEVQMNYLWTTGGKMLVMAVIMLAAAIAISYFASRVGAGVGHDLREKVFHKVMSFSSAEMDQFSTASLITRSTNDVQQIQMVSTMILRMLLYSPILAIGGIYKVWQTGAGMGHVIALAVLVIMGFVFLLVSIAMPKFKAMQKLVDAVNLVSREILTGLSVIRAFGREKTEEQRFDVVNTNLMKTQLFTNRVMTFMMPGMTLIMNGLVVVITWISAHRIDDGSLQVGMMTAFITYAMLIVMSFLMMTMMSIMIPRASVAAERIEEVLHTENTIKETDAPKPAKGTGVLEFKNVCFRYADAEEDVIHDISFKAEPGKVTAIIGSTGAGKSTLVNLIPRFFDVTEGEILLDGINIKDLSLQDLRDQVGFVPQKGVLFSGTIASNLRFGKADADEAELRRAAEVAQALPFIEEKEDGFASHIAQGGSNVSGGQKQRLAIARAIAKQPKIYVFDDSFSALDMKTDAALRKALSHHVADATEVIVAQRISTILHADQIIVLDDGEVVGKGTHSQLMQTCQVYQEIAESQLSAKELAASLAPADSSNQKGEVIVHE